MPKLTLVSDKRGMGKQVEVVCSLKALDPKAAQQSEKVPFLRTYDLAKLQQEQYLHDCRNHQEVLCLHKNDRLKHYGLHFSKYVGRIARGALEPKSFERTLVDVFLVSLSSSNTLQHDLTKAAIRLVDFSRVNDSFAIFADATGRYADACEKIDHLESFMPIISQANIDIVSWALSMTNSLDFDLLSATFARRRELARRPFYIRD